MPNARVHEDIVVGFRNGGARDGTPNFSGSVTALTCNVQSIDYSARDVEIDQTGPCDTFDNLRRVRTNEEISVTMWVDSTAGEVFKALKPNYIELTFSSITSGTTYTLVCVMPEYSFKSQMGSNQMETIRLRRVA